MSGARPPVILIFTASFGDGHNSAARAIAEACEKLMGENVHVELCDPSAIAQPWVNASFKWGYKKIITHFPRLWRKIYERTDKQDMSSDRMRWLSKTRSFVEEKMEALLPDFVVSTYPVFPYFFDAYSERTGKVFPYAIVVTDSLVINRVWKCSHPLAWLVTDEITRQRMVLDGLPEDKILVTGFAVSPRLMEYEPLTDRDWSLGQNPRILYCAHKPESETEDDLKALLKALPKAHITVVLGRNVRRLYPAVARVKVGAKGRIKCLGFTRRMPELLSRHHVVVGKSGGATTHECIAMHIPLIVNHIVFGQEEGNAQLLMDIGMGRLALSADELVLVMQSLFQGDSPQWHVMKRAAQSAAMVAGTAAGRAQGAMTIARFILDKITRQEKGPL